jgi:hypothetical protein
MKSFILSLSLFLFSVNLCAAPKVIHVFVALCDNESQGIVPVPKKIGNGNDPDNNLYWGCGYGVRTFFKQSAEWKLVSKRKNVSAVILERLIFKHNSKDVFMVADGYKGDKIKLCTEKFFEDASGNCADTLMHGQTIIHLGQSSLVCYVGHDGLMDFSIDNYPKQKNNAKKDVIILACASKSYFSKGVKAAGANPLLWTTNLMCPEAYTLKAAIDGWLNNETSAQIHLRAATAYDKYLKCGMKGAKNLFATGF